MAKVALDVLDEIEGFMGACLVDTDSGMVLGSYGVGSVDLEVAAAGNTELVRAKRRVMESLQLKDRIEDILISLERQYHIIRPLEANEALFLYLLLDRRRANLAMARHRLRSFENELNFQ